MSLISGFIRENLRNNFGPTLFMLVAGFIASIFIGYLIIDFLKVVAHNAQRKKK